MVITSIKSAFRVLPPPLCVFPQHLAGLAGSAPGVSGNNAAGERFPAACREFSNIGSHNSRILIINRFLLINEEMDTFGALLPSVLTESGLLDSLADGVIEGVSVVGESRIYLLAIINAGYLQHLCLITSALCPCSRRAASVCRDLQLDKGSDDCVADFRPRLLPANERAFGGAV